MGEKMRKGCIMRPFFTITLIQLHIFILELKQSIFIISFSAAPQLKFASVHLLSQHSTNRLLLASRLFKH